MSHNRENDFAYETAKNAAAIGTIIGARWIEVCDASARRLDGFVGVWIHAAAAGLAFQRAEEKMGIPQLLHFHWIEAIDRYGDLITEHLLDHEPMNQEEMENTALRCIHETMY